MISCFEINTHRRVVIGRADVSASAKIKNETRIAGPVNGRSREGTDLVSRD